MRGIYRHRSVVELTKLGSAVALAGEGLLEVVGLQGTSGSELQAALAAGLPT